MNENHVFTDEEIAILDRSMADVRDSDLYQSWKPNGVGHIMPPKYGNDELDRDIAMWHENSDTELTLYEYLGWTQEEWFHWIQTGEIPKENDIDI